MAKNVTLSYIRDFKPDGINYLPPPSNEIPANRQFIPRLSWLNSPPDSKITYSELAQQISECSLPDARFFLDTCFITNQEVDQSVWDALFQRRIVITPLIWDELQDWIANPVHNKGFHRVLVDARKYGHAAITFFATEVFSEQQQATARYYKELLGLRKRIGLIIKIAYKNKHGRDPSEVELQRERQRYAKDRGLKLAKKGLVDHLKPNFLADEELAVFAVMSGIISGHESTILTRDNDLIEQFYKLVSLVNTHYRCMLVGDSYAKQPLNFLVSKLPNHSRSGHLFEPADGRMLRYPDGFLDAVLPKDHAFVILYCWCLGGTGQPQKLTTLAFDAEREMSPLLDIKGQTSGRNTNSLGGMNCHIYFDKKLHETSPNLAAIAKDNLIAFGGVPFPVVDFEYATQLHERMGG